MASRGARSGAQTGTHRLVGGVAAIVNHRDLRVNTPVLGALTNETDAIGGGFAASIAHPGGNITGFAALDSALGGKWVDLLKEIAPSTVRMAPTPSNRTALAIPLQFVQPKVDRRTALAR
jgi:hypothetical protein